MRKRISGAKKLCNIHLYQKGRTMIKCVKFTYFINFIFTLSCIVQVVKISQNLVSPPNPDIKIYQRELKDLEFPLAFIVCLHDSGNGSLRYQRAGYKDQDNFFTGYRNSGDFGWYGHQMKNGSIIHSVEGSYIYDLGLIKIL